MSISVTCSCGAKLKAPDDSAGKSFACPKCKARVKVPAPTPAPTEDVAETRFRRKESPQPQTRRDEDYDDDEDGARQVQRLGKRKGFPLWVLAVILPVGVLLVGGIAFIAFIAYRNSMHSAEDKGQAGQQEQRNITGPEKKQAQEVFALPPGDMTLKAFILQKPAAPTAVQVDCKLSTFYNWAFRKCAETHYSLEISTASPDLTRCHVYAPKESENGRLLYEALKNGETRRYTLQIQRIGPTGDALPVKDDKCFALVQIVAQSSTGQQRQEHAPAEFSIVQAKFGTGNDWADVTEQVRKLVKDSRLRFVLPREGGALPQLGFPDPAPNRLKQLVVVYSFQGKANSVTVESGQELDIPPMEQAADKLPNRPVKPEDPPLICGNMGPTNELYRAYEDNEVAADAKYLNKPVEFTFSPWAIEKDPSGVYYAWSNIFGLSDDNTRGRHFKCYFREDHATALAAFKRGQVLTIRGVCVGKTGMITSFYPGFNGARGFNKSNPAVVFKECELVGEPADSGRGRRGGPGRGGRRGS